MRSPRSDTASQPPSTTCASDPLVTSSPETSNAQVCDLGIFVSEDRVAPYLHEISAGQPPSRCERAGQATSPYCRAGPDLVGLPVPSDGHLYVHPLDWFRIFAKQSGDQGVGQATVRSRR